MKPDMSVTELAALLPKAMPEGVLLEVGDPVLVRFMRRDRTVYRATILNIFNSVTGEKVVSLTPTRGKDRDMCIKVSVVGDELTERPVWPFQDRIYTYKWVNDWAGMEVAKPHKEKKEVGGVKKRLTRLFGDRDG